MRRRAYFLVLLSLIPTGWALADSGPSPLGAIGAFFERVFHRPRPEQKPKPQPHYVVGDPYQLGGVWQYPRERFGYDETGIAAVIPPGHPPLTTDGEAFDPAAMAAAHRTLQLPAVARVTNLENGRQVLVRINDRGPDSPARLLAVTPHVARLLGFDAEGTARVRVELDQAMSQALAQELQGGMGGLKIAAAPRGAVQATPLAPPAGTAADSGVPPLASAPSAKKPDPLMQPAVPLRLPPAVAQVMPQPGALWIECDSFTNSAYAQRERARLAGLGAQVLRSVSGGAETDTVRIGPLASVAEADAALNRVLHSGVSGARIVVEQE